MTTIQIINHSVIVLALIVAYTVLTILGHDGTAVLALLGGYLGGAAVAQISPAAKV